MKRFPLRIILAAIVALATLVAVAPASAIEANIAIEARSLSQQAPASDTGALHTRAWWAVLGVAIGCGVFGGFYVARKRAGHFDNPTWIAPISKMYSKDFPESFGDAPAEPHDSHH